ncbi:ADS3 [Symbiodinium sp. CCMP2592]|nr:ADS3 [Symbiodinium sp. CCMP2592]
MVPVDALVYKLLTLGAPKAARCRNDFVALVLLTIWTTGLYDLSEAGGTDADVVLLCASLEWIEFYAGSARCTSKVRLKGYTGEHRNDVLVTHGEIEADLQFAIYPTPFAEAVADIFEDLRSSAMGCPAVPDMPSGSGLEAFKAAQTPADVQRLFRQADLRSAYDYMRGGTHLQIPPEWKALFPARHRKRS